MKRTQRTQKAEQGYTCSICLKQCLGYSNNAWPVNTGRCCNECNDTVVIPVRIARMSSKETTQ